MSQIINPDRLYLIFTPAITPQPPYGKIKRWMENGEIVSFTNPKFHFENAEFQINNRPDWIIWFSQLYTPYYNGDLQNPQVCSFKLKNGTYITPKDLPLASFWDAIKGRKFKVTIDPQLCFCVNKESPKVRCLPFAEIDKIYEYVHNKILSGDIETVKGMLKVTKCYDLIEI